jgi:hypothetical protein
MNGLERKKIGGIYNDLRGDRMGIKFPFFVQSSSKPRLDMIGGGGFCGGEGGLQR